MKDNEKQIEEMAKEIETTFTYAKKYIPDKYEPVEFEVYPDEIADKLYNAGYRKLPKDSVVLTKEEYKKLGLVVETIQEYETVNGELKLINEKKILKKLQTDFTDLLNQEIRELQIAQARKETVEKFARDIFNHITTPEVWEKLRQLWLSKDGNFKANKHIYDLLIEPIAKQFGVEIKE